MQSYIEPSESQLRRLVDSAHSDDGPVVMVNLLRFDGEGGRESYLRYAAGVQPHLDRVGAVVLYAGEALDTVIGGDESSWWDAIVLVQYPSRGRFLEMVTDPDYQLVSRDRTAALVTSGLVATRSWSP